MNCPYCGAKIPRADAAKAKREKAYVCPYCGRRAVLSRRRGVLPAVLLGYAAVCFVDVGLFFREFQIQWIVLFTAAGAAALWALRGCAAVLLKEASG